MANEFRKLIKREFGNKEYNRFFSFLREKLEEGKVEAFLVGANGVENDDVYKAMYELLKENDEHHLMKKKEKLTNTMITAMGICKMYLLVVFVYIFAMAFAATMINDLYYMYLAMIFLSSLCLYKTIQYVSNKFCFIDAQLVIVYKIVLDNLLGCKDDNFNI